MSFDAWLLKGWALAPSIGAIDIRNDIRMRIPRTLTCIFILLFSIVVGPACGQDSERNFLRYLFRGTFDHLIGKVPIGGKIYFSTVKVYIVMSDYGLLLGQADQIDAAIKDHLIWLASLEPRFVINAPGHTLADNGVNVGEQLSAIFWDANLPRVAKTDKIINELMVPNSIDILVAAQAKSNHDGSIYLRPFIISQLTKELVTETRTFKREKFECRSPKTGKMILCNETIEDIRDTMLRLVRGM